MPIDELACPRFQHCKCVIREQCTGYVEHRLTDDFEVHHEQSSPNFTGSVEVECVCGFKKWYKPVKVPDWVKTRLGLLGRYQSGKSLAHRDLEGL